MGAIGGRRVEIWLRDVRSGIPDVEGQARRVLENVPLASMTTLGLGGQARRVVVARSNAEAIETVRDADARSEPLLVVGGGSNLVVGDAGFPGTVLRMQSCGIDLRGRRLDVAAGELWDDVVVAAEAAGLAGIECLSGIPGLAGAVPMQNVGAYGQDVAETLLEVRTWDRALGRVVVHDRAACGFGYRSSVFRGSDRHVILSVSFELVEGPMARPVRYAELARALGVREGQPAPLGAVRAAVLALRRSKGMVLDPADPDTRSAGSFFTNPLLDAEGLARLRARVGDAHVPTFADPSGRTKVSAAWLIERAGFQKGFGRGRVAISTKHALALTNRGGATAAELVALAREIRDGVEATFGVLLKPEPVFVGVAL